MTASDKPMVLTPGCVVAGELYRPIVLSTEAAIYFCGDKFDTAEKAIVEAKLSIATTEFRHWHNHEVET